MFVGVTEHELGTRRATRQLLMSLLLKLAQAPPRNTIM
jgi:hypothetical protein